MRISAVLVCLLFPSLAVAAVPGTATSLSATPSSGVVGTSITLNATVTTTGGTSVPHGSVTFYDGVPSQGGVSLGGASLVGAMVAAPKTATLASMLGTIDPTAVGTLLTGDFNGDGKTDVLSYSAVTGVNQTPAFQVFLNTAVVDIRPSLCRPTRF